MIIVFWLYGKIQIWMTYPGKPPDSMWLARVTSFDQTSNCHFCSPITPQRTEPECIPILYSMVVETNEMNGVVGKMFNKYKPHIQIDTGFSPYSSLWEKNGKIEAILIKIIIIIIITQWLEWDNKQFLLFIIIMEEVNELNLMFVIKWIFYFTLLNLRSQLDQERYNKIITTFSLSLSLHRSWY